jgi:hypothetical protein
MPNTWEIRIKRLGVQKSGANQRTYATYQVFMDGKPVAGLSGNMCERTGPGSKTPKSGKRIVPGTYPLSTQFGMKYKSLDFSDVTKPGGQKPMPGILLMKTAPRSAILIHPSHPPTLYISSIGCLNPTQPRTSKQNIDFVDSRSRVIALIDSLKAFAPNSFKKKANTAIPNATCIIEGDPDNVLPATQS